MHLSDVDKSLEWMEKVIGFYHVGEGVEVKIREGPGGEIETYLKHLDQLKEAMEHFNQYNPGSLELVHLTELFYSGMEALIREFRQQLQKHSKPVHIAILHDIGMCEDVEGQYSQCNWHWDTAVGCMQICRSSHCCLLNW